MSKSDEEKRAFAAAFLGAVYGAEYAKHQQRRRRRRQLENMPIVGDLLWPFL